jgi:hypothetical protein
MAVTTASSNAPQARAVSRPNSTPLYLRVTAHPFFTSQADHLMKKLTLLWPPIFSRRGTQECDAELYREVNIVCSWQAFHSGATSRTFGHLLSLGLGLHSPVSPPRGSPG